MGHRHNIWDMRSLARPRQISDYPARESAGGPHPLWLRHPAAPAPTRTTTARKAPGTRHRSRLRSVVVSGDARARDPIAPSSGSVRLPDDGPSSDNAAALPVFLFVPVESTNLKVWSPVPGPPLSGRPATSSRRPGFSHSRAAARPEPEGRMALVLLPRSGGGRRRAG